MSENRGIFSLEEFYDLQVSGETTNIFEVFRYVNSLTTGTPNYGYFGAGAYNPRPEGPIVDRVDFDNDTATATPRSNLKRSKCNNSSKNRSLCCSIYVLTLFICLFFVSIKIHYASNII